MGDPPCVQPLYHIPSVSCEVGDVNHDSNSWRESDWLVSARNARVRGVRGEEGKPKKGSFLSYAEGWGGWDGLFFLSFF